MAGTSLFALIDDITTLLDDVATMTKVAAQKSAGVLGDDLALNAEQVFGFAAEKELPVVWAVAKGSMINKLILIPLALLLAQFLPSLIQPALMLGGAYLCFEGFEKIFHSLQKHKHTEKEAPIALASFNENYEKEKIKGAIRTDFILSAEIIIITLGSVAEAVFLQQVTVLFTIGVLMTVGVYGLVALIVKLDDFGLYLNKNAKLPKAIRSFGLFLIQAAPWLLKILSVLGTVAMFLVGGSLLTHGSHFLVELFASWSNGLLTLLAEVAVGFLVGALVFGLYSLFKKLRPSREGKV